LWHDKFVYTPTKARPFKMDGLLAFENKNSDKWNMESSKKDKKQETCSFELRDISRFVVFHHFG